MFEQKPSPNLVELARVESTILSAICEFLNDKAPSLSRLQLEFLCAPWVHYFSHTIWHRLEIWPKSKPNHSLYIDIENVVLNPPGDTLSFMELIRTDGYPKYLDSTLSGEPSGFQCRTDLYLLKLNLLSRFINTVGFQTCLPSIFRKLLSLTSLGKIWFLEDKPKVNMVHPNPVFRQSLFHQINSSLSFLPPESAAWVALRARDLFPRSLLENLAQRMREVEILPGRCVLFSANGWPLIDDWKIFSLMQKNVHKSLLIGSPHAIGHGCLENFWQRNYELTYLDVYLSWGWRILHDDHVCRLIPFYVPYFAGQKLAKLQKSNRRDGVLISSASRPRHLLEYPYNPEKFAGYLKTQLDLANNVNKLTKLRVSIRSRPKDLGWDLPGMVASLGNPDVSLEFQKGKFLDRLSRSRLHICDNCSTTIAESLIANHPTLVLINNEYFKLSLSARQDFRYLADVGIFHKSVRSLLEHLNFIQGNIDLWWGSFTTQAAIENFLHIQGRNGSSIFIWRKALLGKLPS